MERSINRVVLEVETERKIETASGLVLFAECDYKPELSDPTYGVYIGSRPPVLTAHSTPGAECQRFYLHKGVEKSYRFSDFPNPLEDGDIVWFLHQARLADHWMWENKAYWIRFDHLAFYERNEQLFAMPGRLVLKPIPIEQGFMEYQSVVGEHQDRGVVMAIGLPLNGQDPLPCQVGDVVVFNPRWVDKNFMYRHQRVLVVDFDEVLVVL